MNDKVPCLDGSKPGGKAPVDLVVAAFSSRALAEAAANSGLQVLSIDHFADHDCQKASRQSWQIARWNSEDFDPRSAFGAAPDLDPVRGLPVVIGGGCENCLPLVNWLQGHFSLLGPNAEQLRTLRSPDFWRQAAAMSGLQFPATFPLAHSPPTAESWLKKPFAGAGGLQIQRYQPGKRSVVEFEGQTAAKGHYLQRFVPGQVLGVHCVLFADEIKILGATEAWSDQDWPGPAEFIYRGSWGPIALTEPEALAIERLCQIVRNATHLRGWLQMDFIRCFQSHLWLLEMNPRWAAGMEILHLVGLEPLQQHLKAWNGCLSSKASSVVAEVPGTNTRFARKQVAAKAVVYAPHDIFLTEQKLTRLQKLPPDKFCDIPSSQLSGTLLRQGQPVLTIRNAKNPDGNTPERSLRAELRYALKNLRSQVFEMLSD